MAIFPVHQERTVFHEKRSHMLSVCVSIKDVQRIEHVQQYLHGLTGHKVSHDDAVHYALQIVTAMFLPKPEQIEADRRKVAEAKAKV